MEYFEILSKRERDDVFVEDSKDEVQGGFQSADNHINCLAHVLNLAVKASFLHLKAPLTKVDLRAKN
jgi:hypothetical protein